MCDEDGLVLNLFVPPKSGRQLPAAPALPNARRAPPHPRRPPLPRSARSPSSLSSSTAAAAAATRSAGPASRLTARPLSAPQPGGRVGPRQVTAASAGAWAASASRPGPSGPGRPPQAHPAAVAAPAVKEEQQRASRAAAAAAAEEAAALGRLVPAGASWAALGLEPRVAARASELGYAAPTRVQALAAGPLLAGRDLLLRAETGSGKTAAYLLPLAHRLYGQRLARADGTLALVLVPTRELALQVHGVAAALLRPFHWLVTGCLIGGERRKSEKARLRKGMTLVVGTPGRVRDHLEHTEAWRLGGVESVVLDEADRLVELGQEQDVRFIMARLLRARRPDAPPLHAVLTSATLAPSHPNLRPLADLALSSPLFLDANTALAPAHAAPKRKTEPPPAGSDSADDGADSRRPGALAGGVDEDDDDEEEDLEEGAAGKGMEDDSSSAAEGEGADEGEAAEEEADAEEPMGAGAEDGTLSVPAGLRQHFTLVPAKLRLVLLVAFLRARAREAAAGGRAAKVILFVNTSASVEFHAAVLQLLLAPDAAAGAGVAVHGVHGSLDLDARKAAVRAVAQAAGPAVALQVLVATDVAGRGLDLGRVDAVLLLDAPTQPVDYVHRVGRTARIGRAGASHLWLLPSEREYVALLGRLGLRLTELPATPLLDALVSRGAAPPPGSADYWAWAERATRPLQAAIEQTTAAAGGGELARAAFKAAVRAYATHPKDARHIFHLSHLHLGHLARAYGLRDAPSKLKRKRDATSAPPRAAQQRPHGRKRSASAAALDEFAE